MTQIVEITIYEQNYKQYCENCKPEGRSKKGTLVISGYDYFCCGCGESFKEIAERKGDIEMEKYSVTLPLQKRAIKRHCIWCEREYTCWDYPDEPDGLCSEKCEQAQQDWDNSVTHFFHSEEE
jgi:hypothetical protein